MNRFKIAIIGGGTMGEAILSSLIDKKVFSVSQIVVTNPTKKRRDFLTNKYRVKTFNDNKKAAIESDIILLAVKPQITPLIFQEIKSLVKDKLIISIMAGISVSSLKKRLAVKKIVRAMPNTAARIGLGTTLWLGINLSSSEKNIVQKIFDSMGLSIQVKNDKMIDFGSTISGSGPAYIFLIMEILEKLGREFGFSKNQVQEMVKQTFWGAVNLQRNAKISNQKLIEQVASKKGTTLEALKVFKQKKLEDIFRQALNSAVKRASQLSKKYG